MMELMQKKIIQCMKEKKYGRLTIIEVSSNYRDEKRCKCKCECGNQKGS